jgi:hypothetical protein
MSYNSLQPLGDNYIAATFWTLATLHGQSFYPEIIESFAQTVSDVLDGFIRTPIETDYDFQRAFSGPFDTLGTPLPSSHSVGMQQNWLVGLTVAPMKLATSG